MSNAFHFTLSAILSYWHLAQLRSDLSVIVCMRSQFPTISTFIYLGTATARADYAASRPIVMSDDSDLPVDDAALHAAFREWLGPLPQQARSRTRAMPRKYRTIAPADASRPSALSSPALASTHESIDCAPRGVSTLTHDERKPCEKASCGLTDGDSSKTDSVFYSRGLRPKIYLPRPKASGGIEQAFSLGGLKCLISRVADECCSNATTTSTGQKLTENALSAVMSKQSTERPRSFGSIK
jgi:hypothetical protein